MNYLTSIFDYTKEKTCQLARGASNVFSNPLLSIDPLFNDNSLNANNYEYIDFVEEGNDIISIIFLAEERQKKMQERVQMMNFIDLLTIIIILKHNSNDIINRIENILLNIDQRYIIHNAIKNNFLDVSIIPQIELELKNAKNILNDNLSYIASIKEIHMLIKRDNIPF